MSRIGFTQRTINGTVIKEITCPNDFWAVEYVPESKQIVKMTVYADDPETSNGMIIGGRVAAASNAHDGFGWDGDYQDFLNEIDQEGLIYPTE